METTRDKSAELRRGVIVFIALAVLTAIEYGVGLLETSTLSVILLVLLGLLKAGLVMWFFMHLPRVFQSEGGHE